MIAVGSLIVLAIMVGGTALVHARPDWFATLSWTEADQRVALPRVAVSLTLLGWAFSSAVILTGASRWNLGVLVAAGLLQLFAILFTAFVGGKSFWLAAPTWLLAIFAAMSPAASRESASRSFTTVLLCALATWHTYLLTPLSSGGRPPAWGWLIVLFAVSAFVILRLPQRLTVLGGFVAAIVVYGGLLWLALRAGEVAMARGLVLPSTYFVGLFAVLWFVLGGELVEGAVGAANFAIRLAASAVREAILPVVLCGLWLAELVGARWLLSRVSDDNAMALSLHQWVAGGLLVIAVVLLVRRRLTTGWARGLLAAWVFSFVALRAYFSGLGDVVKHADPADTGAIALALFALAIANMVVKLLIAAPQGQGRGAEAGLLLKLGALTFLAAGTQFEFAMRNTEVIKQAAVYQFAGATALFLPLLLALLVTEQRWVPAPSRALLTRAFLVGFAASFAVELLRAGSYGPGGWTLASHLGTVAFATAVQLACIGGLIRFGSVVDRVAATAVAIACALGFAVGCDHDLLINMLNDGVRIVLSLMGGAGGALGSALSEFSAWSGRARPAIPAADHYYFFVTSLLPAAVAGPLIARARRGHGWALGVTGVVVATAVALGLASVTYVHPLFTRESRFPVPFYEVAQDPGALALLLTPAALLALWLYLAVWRPERQQRDRAETAPVLAGLPKRGPARHAGPMTIGALALVIGGVGLAVAMSTPSPMERYQDTRHRFAIDYPRGWRVQPSETGETRFYLDDPREGVVLIVNPGVALPPNVTAAQLLGVLDRHFRTLYQDIRVTATTSTPRVEGARSVQQIELKGTWTLPGKGRFRGTSLMTLVSAPDASRYSSVSYQIPELASASMEASMARAMRSYRVDSN
jgi:hypothetical protein